MTMVVLGVVFEIAGPLSARIAVDRNGESRAQDHEPLLPFDDELRTD